MIGKLLQNRYHILREIGSGAMSAVYYAQDLARNKTAVAVKALRGELTSSLAEDMIRFRNEAIAASRLNHPHIIKIFDILETVDGPLIVMDYIEGRSLAEISAAATEIPAAPLALEDALTIARQIADALAHVHRAGIIHRDLKPGNIMLSRPGHDGPESSRPWATIIDFGLAKVKDYARFDDRSSARASSGIVGTFRYMAPEALTGSASVDERSDLYSLGIILYEIIAGRPPFSGSDATTLIHQQLAKIPEPLSRHISGLPPVIDGIVIKLLAKEPMERYQSARGLLADLDRLLAGERDFTPGLNDRIIRLRFKTALMGRDSEVRAIHERMSQALAGRGSICLIAGEAGMGKTMLTDDIKRYRFQRGGIGISGGCFAGDSKTPYGPFAEAINGYLRYFNAYPEQKKNELRAALAKAVGGLGGLLTGLSPIITDIIGETRPVAPINPDREKVRFLMTVCAFLRGLARAEGGMLMVLEDLQWSDEASLSLLAALASEMGSAPIFILGTFRDTEIDYRHGLKKLLIDAKINGLPLCRIDLAGFSTDDMARYLSGILHREIGDAGLMKIVDFVSIRSGGNPLFARELVKQMVDEGTIVFDADDRLLVREQQLDNTLAPDSVIDTILRRADRLEAEERNVLSLAAVLGRTFSLPLLLNLYAAVEHAGDNPAPEAAVNEAPVAIIDRAITLQVLEENPGRRGTLSFAHDTIREAFYGALHPARRQELHRHIVKTLESLYRDTINDDPATCPAIFDLANHAMQSGAHPRLAIYTLAAGNKAREQHAYEEALAYLERAHATFQADGGGPALIPVLRMIGEVELLAGNFDQAIARYQTLLPLFDNDDDRAYAYKQISQAFYKKGDLAACEHYGRIGLGILGERLPRSAIGTIMSLARELLVHVLHNLIPVLLARKKPVRESGRHGLIVWFYYSLGWAYFINDYIKLARTTLRILNIAERHLGPSRELALGQAIYGVICTGIRRFDRSLAYHVRALRIREGIGDEWGIAQSHQAIGWCYYCKGDLEKAIVHYSMSIDGFDAIGDLKEVGNSLSGIIWAYGLLGNYQNEKSAIDRYHAIAGRIGDDYALCYSLLFLGLYHFDTGSRELARDYLDRARELSRERKIWNVHCLALIHEGRMYGDDGDIDKALDCFAAGREIEKNHHLLPEIASTLYYDSIEIAVVDYNRKQNFASPAQRQYYRKIRRMVRRSLRSGRSSVVLYGNVLRAAAKFYALANHRKADRYFQRSIAILQKFNIRADHGRTLCDYGVFLGATGRFDRGRALIEEAYALLGAIGHTGYLQKPRELLGISGTDAASVPSLQTYYRKVKDDKKIASIIELIREISLDRPIDQIMHSALERLIAIIGASRGCIILMDKQGELHTAASISINESSTENRSSTIIKKTIAIGEPILTTDAEVEQAFSGLESVSYYDLKSIISVPIRFQNRVLGVCYLDNLLTRGVFSEGDIETVQIIMDQISVTIAATLLEPTATPGIESGPSDAFCDHHGITRREREILTLVIQGHSRKEISRMLDISYPTVKFHSKNILDKLGVKNDLELIKMVQRGI